MPRGQPRGKSSTDDILGGTKPNGKVPAKWAEHHQALSELRDRFSGVKNSRNESARIELSSSGEHIADAATDSYDRDWALAMATSAQSLLYEIDEALNRIVNGTYGICELTGKPIEAARLKAVPWARFSAHAQAELEAHGVAARVRLGNRGSWLETAETTSANDIDIEGGAASEREREAA